MKTPQQDYWQNPRAHVDGLDEVVNDTYIYHSKPEWYTGLNAVSHYLCEVINMFHGPTRVLEPGCGPGRNLDHLHKRGFDVLGIEINPNGRKVAEQYFPEIADKISIGSVEKYLPALLLSVPIMLTSGFLMHIPPASEYVFALMAQKCTRYLIVNEVEGVLTPTGQLRFLRNYKDVFESLGFDQIAAIRGMRVPAIEHCTTRVFRRKR